MHYLFIVLGTSPQLGSAYWTDASSGKLQMDKETVRQQKSRRKMRQEATAICVNARRSLILFLVYAFSSSNVAVRAAAAARLFCVTVD